MSILRLATASAIVAVTGLMVGCAHERPRPKVETTAAKIDLKANRQVNVSDEIRFACKIEEPERAPKFELDSATLSLPDREILVQVARCLTTGPLRGRSIELVGHADPRGETEYNMGLGEERAANVNYYLSALGVGAAQVKGTSRGELDATGVDEDGWRIDRRVDVRLND